MVLPDNRRLSSAFKVASMVSMSSVPKPSSGNNDSSLERPLLRSEKCQGQRQADQRRTRCRIRISTGRCSPAFYRSINIISFRSTALNAYLEVISDKWRFASVMRDFLIYSGNAYLLK